MYSGSNKMAVNFDKNREFFNVAASSVSFSLYPTYSNDWRVETSRKRVVC